MSIARRTFPSRLELKRRAGSLTEPPLAKVNFTLDLYVSPVQMIPSCDHVGVPGFVGFTHFNSSTTSGSASLMSVRTLLRVFPRQSLSSAILFEMSCDGDWFDITYLVQSRQRRPAEGNKLADAAVPQVQASPGENSYDQRNRRARRVCDPQMSGHRAAEIAGHHDCGEDRCLRDKVEHHQGAFRNDNGDDGRFGIAIARNDFGHGVGVVSSPDPSAAQEHRDRAKGKEPAGPEHPAGNGEGGGGGGCTRHRYLAFQYRTALRTRRSVAASRPTSWPGGRRCVQWAGRRAAAPTHRGRCATRQHPSR